MPTPRPKPLCTAGELLDRWLKKKEESRADFAARLEVDRTVLWRWMVGDLTPNITQGAEIERITGIKTTMWARPGAFSKGAA